MAVLATSNRMIMLAGFLLAQVSSAYAQLSAQEQQTVNLSNSPAALTDNKATALSLASTPFGQYQSSFTSPELGLPHITLTDTSQDTALSLSLYFAPPQQQLAINDNYLPPSEQFLMLSSDFGDTLFGQTQSLFDARLSTQPTSTMLYSTLSSIWYQQSLASYQPNYALQLRWASPNIAGWQLVMGLSDLTGNNSAAYETEINYLAPIGKGQWQLWAAGSLLSEGADPSNNRQFSIGGQLEMGRFSAKSFFYDRDESYTFLTGDLADDTSQQRKGYHVQAGYFLNAVSAITLSFDKSSVDRTFDDKTRALGLDFLGQNSATTIGFYHDMTTNLKMVAEFTNQESEWHQRGESDSDTILSVGGHLSW